jgi:hypothetical protein
MNAIGGMFKDEKKQGNHPKQFVFIVGSCVHFRSFKVHYNMNVENTIEKPQRITREKEAQKNEHKRRREEEEKLLRKIEIE